MSPSGLTSLKIIDSAKVVPVRVVRTATDESDVKIRFLYKRYSDIFRCLFEWNWEYIHLFIFILAFPPGRFAGEAEPSPESFK